jgi:hypothetical protein
MQSAEGAAAPGEREIGGFFGKGCFEFEFGAALSQGSLKLDFGLINLFARPGPLFFAQGPELFKQGSELAMRPQKVPFGLFEGGQVSSPL